MEPNELTRAFRAVWWHASEPTAHAGPHDDLSSTIWCARMAELRLTRVAADDWTVDMAAGRPSLAKVGNVVFHVTARGSADEVVLDFDGALVYLVLGPRGYMSAVAAASTVEAAKRALARIREAYPKQVPTGQRITMKFWSYARAGGSRRDETLDVCRWDEIGPNYAVRTRAELEPLMRPPDASESGKLLLWLGPPGTGKTFALRALAWEQRERVTIHYILDPEIFLSRVDYVMSVFRDDVETDDDDHADYDDPQRLLQRKRARLIVLEDAGELLGADAMARAGHGLSRLLNLTDGLPGQATRTRILITTNEDVGRLHPAVTRPGRCAALVRFANLDEAEAASWLRARSRGDLVPERGGAATIATLYARLSGAVPLAAPGPSVGFTTSRADAE